VERWESKAIRGEDAARLEEGQPSREELGSSASGRGNNCSLAGPDDSVGTCAISHALAVASNAGGVGNTHAKFILVVVAVADAQAIISGLAAADTVAVENSFTVANVVAIIEGLTAADTQAIGDSMAAADAVAIEHGRTTADTVAIEDGITVADTSAIRESSTTAFAVTIGNTVTAADTLAI